MISTKTFLAALTATAAAALCSAAPASADTLGPAVKYFKAPLPVVGGTLSDSSGTPSFSIKDGWAVNDGDGICSAYTNLYQSSTGTRQVWTAPNTGRSVTSLIGNTATWTTKVDSYDELYTNATDCLGNAANYAYDYIEPGLDDQGAGSFGPGWSTSAGAVWSGGSVMKSSTVGASVSYSFSGRLVSLVSDRAADRGKVSLSVDGGTATTVALNGATQNRRIVWNSKYLSSGTHLLTAKVVSGRVDVDAFLTQS
jgi:hypothetical protein